MRSFGSLLFLIAALAIAAPRSSAHLLSSPIPRGRVEIGIAHTWSHRDLESWIQRDFDWEDDFLFGRYGVTDRLTLSAEVWAWDRGAAGTRPGRDYRVQRVGGGFSLDLISMRNLGVEISAHWARSIWFDRSDARYNKEVKSRLAAFRLKPHLPFGVDGLTLWFGPVYCYDEYVEYPWGSDPSTKWESSGNFGIAFGQNLLVMDRLEISAYLLYADYWQPRLAIAYRPGSELKLSR
jgi:hypothetical protein